MNRAIGTFAIVTALTLSPAARAQDPPPKTAFRQVQMHVWISETTEQGLRDLGTNLTYSRVDPDSGNAIQQVSTNLFDPGNPLFDVTLPAPNTDLFGQPLRPDRDDSTAGIQSTGGGGLTFTLLGNDHQLDGVFRAIETSNDIDLISKPEILVIENMKAEIKAGGKVPYQNVEYNNKGQSILNVAFKDVGVSLQVTPTIRNDDLIQLNFQQLEVTDVTRVDNIRGIDLPVFAMRSQTGIVLVPDGQALVIGGLSSRVRRATERRVPLLGRIPILGIPFRARQTDVTNTHLMIFVAPTVVDLRKMTPGAMNALDFWRQGDWRNEKDIQQEIDVMERTTKPGNLRF